MAPVPVITSGARPIVSKYISKIMDKKTILDGRMMGAILAAGRGSRMWPFSSSYPKPVLPICNKPLITYQIEMMREIGITDIVVLIGHKGYEITKVLGDGHGLGVRLQYVEQVEALGLAHAVGHLEPVLDRPFVLFLGDVFFKAPRLKQLIATFFEREAAAVLATKDEPDLEAIRRNFSVIQGADGYVTRVIEKPRHPPNRVKGVGLYMFDLTVFDAVRRTPRTAMRDEFELTETIQVMIDDGHRVCAAEVVDDDLNLTNPYDLLAINLREAKDSFGGVLVHPTAELLAPELVKRSVVGARVQVSNVIAIEDSLIFEDTQVSIRRPLRHAIVTPHGVLDCSTAQTEDPADA